MYEVLFSLPGIQNRITVFIWLWMPKTWHTHRWIKFADEFTQGFCISTNKSQLYGYHSGKVSLNNTDIVIHSNMGNITIWQLQLCLRFKWAFLFLAVYRFLDVTVSRAELQTGFFILLHPNFGREWCRQLSILIFGPAQLNRLKIWVDWNLLKGSAISLDDFEGIVGQQKWIVLFAAFETYHAIFSSLA